jgi:hypothetical protein
MEVSKVEKETTGSKVVTDIMSQQNSQSNASIWDLNIWLSLRVDSQQLDEDAKIDWHLIFLSRRPSPVSDLGWYSSHFSVKSLKEKYQLSRKSQHGGSILYGHTSCCVIAFLQISFSKICPCHTPYQPHPPVRIYASDPLTDSVII